METIAGDSLVELASKIPLSFARAHETIKETLEEEVLKLEREIKYGKPDDDIPF